MVPTAKEMETLTQRFMGRFIPEPNTGCWLWEGATDTFGYGRLRWRNLFLLTHRLSYRIHRGPIPDGMNILHSCDVPCCVNPDHLRPGTQSDNTADMLKRKRWRAGDRALGEQHVNSRLTEEQVIEAKQRIGSSTGTYKGMAREFGVNHKTLRNAVLGITWKHLGDVQ